MCLGAARSPWRDEAEPLAMLRRSLRESGPADRDRVRIDPHRRKQRSHRAAANIFAGSLRVIMSGFAAPAE